MISKQEVKVLWEGSTILQQVMDARMGSPTKTAVAAAYAGLPEDHFLNRLRRGEFVDAESVEITTQPNGEVTINHAPDVVKLAPQCLVDRSGCVIIRLTVAGDNGEVEYELVSYDAAREYFVAKRIGGHGDVPR